jgi:hypothetical protein
VTTAASGPDSPTTPPDETEAGPDRREVIGRCIVMFLFPLAIVSMMVAGNIWPNHSPSPHDMPIAVSGPAEEVDRLVAAMESADPGAADIQVVNGDEEARSLVIDREVAGAVSIPEGGGPTQVYTASAAGASQASVVQGLVTPQLLALGLDSQVQDLVPLPSNDSAGLAVMFTTLAFLMAGYMPLSLLLSTSPRLLRLRTVVPLLAGWAVLTSTLIWCIVGPILGAISGHAGAILAVGWLSVFAVGSVQVFLVRILGPLAVFAALLFISVLGTPASGLALSIYTMPQLYSVLYRFLPTPATGEALRSIVYFGGTDVWPHLAVLILAAVIALALSALVDEIKRRRNPGIQPPEPSMYSLTGGDPHSTRGRYFAVAMFPLLIITMMLAILLSAMYQPSPKDMPIAVAGSSLEQSQQAAADLQQSMGDLFDLRAVSSADEAIESVRDRTVVAAYILPSETTPEATLVTNQAAGVSQQQLTTSVFTQVAANQGVPLTIDNVAPLDARDSAGSVAMYIAMGWVMAAFLFVVVGANAAPMVMGLRTFLPLLTGWSLFISAFIWVLAGPIIGAIVGHFWMLWAVGAVAVFCMALFSLIWVRLFGLYGVIPIIAILMFLGTPASGGGLSIYMTPDIFRALHAILPMPAAVESIRSILYFDSDTVGRHLLTFVIWGVLSLLVVIVIDRIKPPRTSLPAPRADAPQVPAEPERSENPS